MGISAQLGAIMGRIGNLGDSKCVVCNAKITGLGLKYAFLLGLRPNWGELFSNHAHGVAFASYWKERSNPPIRLLSPDRHGGISAVFLLRYI